ncbi:MAG: hypothetical protein LJE68_12085 [Rhodobacter sp.]|nr:hypothetical protein [Rhodobacter sp.]
MLVATKGMGAAHSGLIGAMTSANSANANGASEDPIMAYAPAQLARDQQYEPFLSAPVGEDRHETSVTVLSMLARLGVDPWREASDLAKLPEGAARQRLETLMARFSDVSTSGPDRSRIVPRLLAFLPKQAKSPDSSAGGTPVIALIPPQGSRFYWIIAAVLFFGWIAMLAQGQ